MNINYTLYFIAFYVDIYTQWKKQVMFSQKYYADEFLKKLNIDKIPPNIVNLKTDLLR